jgi:hypothetical protein
MATATRTVESLDSLRAVNGKIVEPRPLEARVKIAQGVPDPRSVHKLIKLLSPKWRLRYSNHQNDLSPQIAAELVDELSPPPMTTNVQRATTEAITGKSLSSRTTIPKSLEPNIELPPEVQSCDAAAIPDLSASNHALQPDAQNSDATAIKQAVPTASAAQATNTTNNLGQPEQTDEPPQIPSDGGETMPSARSAVAVGSVTSNHAGVQRVFESEVRSIPSPPPIQQPQPIQQNVQSVLPEFKFIGPNSKSGRRSLWGKVQAFRRFSENVYLATRISPGSEYVKQWEEKWEPTLKQEMYDLIIDQNDIFTFDLRMTGPNDDAVSMKPTILVICDESHKNSIENKLGSLVKQTVPKDVRFQVIGKRISTASPSGEQSRDFDGDLRVEFKASNYPLETLMGSVARIHSHENIRSAPGFALSTIGGLVAVGDKLYALTTAHSLFQGFSYVDPTSSGFKPCGKVQSYKWLEHASEKSFQNRLKTSMDWALISIPDELAFPNHFLIDKATGVGGQVVGFARNDEFLAEEDVWICSSSETQCGILNSTSVSFHLDSATFKVRTVMLEHCLGRLLNFQKRDSFL